MRILALETPFCRGIAHMVRLVVCWCVGLMMVVAMGRFAGAADDPAAKPTPAAAKPAESSTKATEPVGKQAEGSPKAAAPAAKPGEVPAAKPGEASAAKPGETPSKPAEPSSKSGDAAGKAGEKCKDTAPATHTVKREPLKVTITLDGVFEAQTSREIFVKPEEWSMLSVEEAAQHGQHVRKGDVLLTLDTEKLDRVIDDLRAEQKLSDLSIQQSEDQLKALEKAMPLDLETSKRLARISEEDKQYFFDVAKPFTVKMNDFSLKISKENLEYEEEELHQLEKMYKADDITEETEQIVLKRARDAVEKARFMVEYAKINHDETMRFGLPRTEEMVKESTLRRTLEWEKKKLELPLAVQRQRLDLEKLRLQRSRTEDRLKKLQGDREMMTVKSPIDGIVYYGKSTRGRFSDSTGMAENLRRNGIIQPNQVVMTVVDPRPMFIRASVSEDALHDLHPGMSGKVTPSSYPEPKLNATLDDVSDVPISPGNFDAKLSVKLSRKSKFLMPGMTCKIKLTPYVKKNALAVPPKTVQTDELDDEKHYVWVLEKDGKPKKRDVELGKKTDKLQEIVKGLAEGEKVLLEPPKEEKAK